MRMRTTVLIAAVVVVLLAGAFVVWRVVRSDDTVRVKASTGGTVRGDSGVTVRFAPGALSDDTDVRIKAVDVAPPEGMEWGGEPVDITLDGGSLRSAATVTFPLAGDDDPLIVSRHGDAPWVNEGGVADGKTITTVVSHFSIVGRAKARAQLAYKILKVPAQLGAAVVSAYRDASYRAPDPKCAPASQTWRGSVRGDNVKVCVAAGTDGHRPRLKVVNNRLYGQFLQLRGYPPMQVTQPDKVKLVDNVWRMLGDANRDYTYLPGKGTIELELPAGYRLIDFLARPGLEAVIAQFVVDVLSVAMLPVGLLVSAVQCVLAAPVTEEVARTFDLKRVPELGGALNNCVSASTKAWSGLGEGAGDAQKDEAAKARAKEVDAITTAIKDAPTLVQTLLRSPIQQVKSQHVIAERTAIVPTRALNEEGGNLPAAVVATQKRLYDAASGYGSNRFGIVEALPKPGLQFGNAADPGQKPSLTLGSEPDPVAGPKAANALADLTSTPPMHWRCTETGRDSYVYGLADPELNTYAGRVAALGFAPEEAGAILDSARAARPYRICIDPDGTWTAFSRATPPEAFPEALAAKLPEKKTGYQDCPVIAPNPFTPVDAACQGATKMDIDGDGRTDTLLTFRRSEQWTARAVMARGPVADLTLPIDQDQFPPVQPVVLTHTDFDGVAGDEAVIVAGFGAHSQFLVMVTYTKDKLLLVRHNGVDDQPEMFTEDANNKYSIGIGCSDHDHNGVPELVEASAFFETLPANGSQTRWTWHGKTLNKADTTEVTNPAWNQPPYRGITCVWK
ncbi:hypothetical protein ACQPZX_38660 [Actinoplanes sp. CA-142083]|uniref:hypothetical protein n=1 Tax=Actinoplanes sp. CA-142083 TaxID=3239903 RepID=UPI003D924273